MRSEPQIAAATQFSHLAMGFQPSGPPVLSHPALADVLSGLLAGGHSFRCAGALAFGLELRYADGCHQTLEYQVHHHLLSLAVSRMSVLD